MSKSSVLTDHQVRALCRVLGPLNGVADRDVRAKLTKLDSIQSRDLALAWFRRLKPDDKRGILQLLSAAGRESASC